MLRHYPVLNSSSRTVLDGGHTVPHGFVRIERRAVVIHPLHTRPRPTPSGAPARSENSRRVESGLCSGQPLGSGGPVGVAVRTIEDTPDVLTKRPDRLPVL